MAEITYVDLHCDTLTACCRRGERLRDCALQINLGKLKQSRCAAQCFAIFTQGEGAAAEYERALAAFLREQAEGGFFPVTRGRDLDYCVENGVTGGILTVENLGFIGEDLQKLDELYRSGVRMASLVWNRENLLAYPNLRYEDGKPLLASREERGLKEAGRRAVERMDELGIILDLSHLSDGGAREILRGRTKPLVASHSDAAAVCGASRNLTDGLIRAIADCGGVIGVNFCADFVGNPDLFAGIAAHIRHLAKIGGEDVLSLGSDFDGIPAPEGLEDCTRVPFLFSYLRREGFPPRVLEKLARKNFMRVFCEVCGR